VDLDLGVRNAEELRRDDDAELAGFVDDEIGPPRLGESEQVRDHPTGGHAAEDVLVHELLLRESAQRTVPRPQGGLFRTVAPDAGRHPAEAVRLHGAAGRGRCPEGDVVPGLGQRAGNRRERQEVAHPRLTGE
jgi:hypothetical protein